MELINADCRSVLAPIMARNSEKLVFVSDPPFNIGYKYNTYKDRMGENEYLDMLSTIFSKPLSVSKGKQKYLPFVIVHYAETLYKLAIKMGKAPEKVVSWVYNSNTSKQHRDIAFFNIQPDFKQVKQPYKNPNDKRIKKLIENGSEGTALYDWWNINQVKNVSKEKTAHPCQMPLAVMENIIGVLPYDSIIVDPFMGSGTTGLAVKKMNKKQNAKRDFIGIEVDKKYFDIAKARIKNEE